jgi:hypothetical protein
MTKMNDQAIEQEIQDKGLTDGLCVWSRIRALFGRKMQFPTHPQLCPHCGTEILRGWAEGEGSTERFFVQHGAPICRSGAEKLEVFLLTEREIECFRYWTHNAELRPTAGQFPQVEP